MVLWKSGKVVCCRLHACLGVNFDGNPNWVLIFDFPKQVLNNTPLGVILFQTWHLSLNSCIVICYLQPNSVFGHVSHQRPHTIHITLLIRKLSTSNVAVTLYSSHHSPSSSSTLQPTTPSEMVSPLHQTPPLWLTMPWAVNITPLHLLLRIKWYFEVCCQIWADTSVQPNYLFCKFLSREWNKMDLVTGPGPVQWHSDGMKTRHHHIGCVH